MKFSKLERKARAVVKDTSEMRALNRKRAMVDKQFAACKISKSQKDDLKSLLRLRRRHLVNRAMYKITKAAALRSLAPACWE